jgi:hypothetical protein
MGDRQRAPWPKTFRRKAVELMQAGYRASELSSSLKIPLMTLHHWRKTGGQSKATASGPARAKNGSGKSRYPGFSAVRIVATSDSAPEKVPPSAHTPGEAAQPRYRVQGPYGLKMEELSLLDLAWLWQYLVRMDPDQAL